MSQLNDNISSVVTHSSGNHALALTKVARMMGKNAHIIMPNNAPQIKEDTVREYGGNITFCEPTLEARERTAKEIINETNGVEIHSYNNVDVIAGHGSICFELMDDIKDLDCILVPIGGGGMISGITLASLTSDNKPLIIGCEPFGADDAYQSKTQNKFIPVSNPNTIADGLRTSLGSNTLPIVLEHVHSIVS